MELVQVSLDEAEGHISAHNLFDAEGRKIVTKGRRIASDQIERLRRAGVREIYVARLARRDVPEDEAARRLAQCMAGENVYFKPPATGRANLRAGCAGVLRVNKEAAARLNAADSGIGLATLASHEFVQPHQLIATVKIIPFAIAAEVLQEIEHALGRNESLLRVEPLRLRRVGVAICAHPPQQERVLRQYRPALVQRMRKFAAEAVAWLHCDYHPAEIAQAIRQLQNAGAELILLVGMSAVVDIRDVIPQGIAAAGAVIEQFGFPVDPGNLTLLAYLDGMPIVAVPGCARSPKRNALDLIWPRLMCGERLRREQILQMGHGGLLEEIFERPLPREQADAESE